MTWRDSSARRRRRRVQGSSAEEGGREAAGSARRGSAGHGRRRPAMWTPARSLDGPYAGPGFTIHSPAMAKRSVWREYLEALLIAAIFLRFANTFVLQTFYI